MREVDYSNTPGYDRNTSEYYRYGSGYRGFDFVSRVVMIAAMVVATICLLAQTGAYGALSGSLVGGEEAWQVASAPYIDANIGGDDESEVEEEIIVVPTVTVKPDMIAAARLMGGVSAAVSLFMEDGATTNGSGAADWNPSAFTSMAAAGNNGFSLLANDKPVGADIVGSGELDDNGDGGALVIGDGPVPSAAFYGDSQNGSAYNGSAYNGNTNINMLFNGFAFNGAGYGGAAQNGYSNGYTSGYNGYNGYMNGYHDGDGAGFPAVHTFFSSLYNFSYDVASAHQAQLDMRADSLSYARQLAAAKYLAQAAYQTQIAGRQAFIDAHGKSAADMSEGEINAKYNNDYFMERLREMGFFRNDKYSNDVNRRNAIIRAQSAFNLPITAKIDLETKRALIDGTDYVPRDYFTEAHPEGMWVVINRYERHLTLYIDDTVIAKYPVAVGSPMRLTPEGKFTFVSKAVNPRWGGGGHAAPVAGGAPNNPLGKRWMGLSIGGGGSYGVHGNISAYSIGTFASNGCIRMINTDVEQLYEVIQIGTPVWVGTTEKLQEWGVYQMLGSWEPDQPDFHDYLPQSLLYEE
ncbi:MAG: L,D-transpeptidase [Oscillospiraceae bacterium]|nr:L,D-transpeptidase [Oscillospiraceae bacterium]